MAYLIYSHNQKYIPTFRETMFGFPLLICHICLSSPDGFIVFSWGIIVFQDSYRELGTVH